MAFHRIYHYRVVRRFNSKNGTLYLFDSGYLTKGRLPDLEKRKLEFCIELLRNEAPVYYNDRDKILTLEKQSRWRRRKLIKS